MIQSNFICVVFPHTDSITIETNECVHFLDQRTWHSVSIFNTKSKQYFITMTDLVSSYEKTSFTWENFSQPCKKNQTALSRGLNCRTETFLLFFFEKQRSKQSRYSYMGCSVLTKVPYLGAIILNCLSCLKKNS